MSGFGLIYKWLSGVDHEPTDPAHSAPDKQTETQNTQRAADKSTERRRTTNEKYSARFLSLELTNPVSPAPANPPSQVNKYERRPRHKTKPDRYEYKESSRADGKESRKRKRHASKLKRKHMVNDDFHASNVAQSRLTLQSGRNMGIFQKGKTSTPVKSGELPDLAFSEMKFLSKQPQLGYKEAMPKYRERKMEGNKGKESQKRPDYSTRFETHPVPTPMSIQAANPFSSQVAGSDLPRNSSPIGDNLSLYQPYHGEYAPNEHLSNHKDNSSGDEGRPHPRSASFYTWSENRSNSNDLFEFCLAKVLPADLTRSINAPTANIDPNKQYLDVEQLKELLNNRKRSWESEFAHSDAASGRHPKRKRRLPALEDRPHSKDSGRHRIPTLGKFMVDNPKPESNRSTLPESPSLPYSNSCRVLYPNNWTYENRAQEEQAGRQNDANLEFLRQELKHPDTHRNDLNRDSYRQQRQPLDLSEARNPILDSEMQWINTLDLSRLTNGTPEVENEQLFIQSLDDAYNRILNPGSPRYAQEDIPGDESSLNPEARGVTAEWTHGLGRNANEPQSRMLEPSGPNSGGKCWPSSIHRPILEPFSQESRGESLAAARPSPLGMWEAANELKRASTSYPCIEIAGFWRRNKLY